MRSTTKLLLTLVCTLAACGGDDAGPVDSGIAPEKTGKELTADEQDKLCVAVQDNLVSQNSAAELKEFACVLNGLLFTAMSKNTVEECEVVAKACRDGAGEEGGDEGSNMCTLSFDITTCEATIGDIEACATEKNEAFGRAVREASCSSAGQPPEAAVTGPACSKIKTTCPGIA